LLKPAGKAAPKLDADALADAVRTALDATLKLEPKHAEAHTALRFTTPRSSTRRHDRRLT